MTEWLLQDLRELLTFMCWEAIDSVENWDVGKIVKSNELSNEILSLSFVIAISLDGKNNSIGTDHMKQKTCFSTS